MKPIAISAKSIGFLAFLALPVIIISPARSAVDVSGSIGQGYRVDRLDWNIAGDTSGQNPNILSELTWKDLKIYEVSGDLRTDWGEALTARVDFDYGVIMSGDNQDSDYAGDNRTGEFSRSNNKGKGHVYDASFGMGHRFRSGRDRLAFTPLLGYAYNKQNLRITDGFQTIPANGAFAGLNSAYRTQWWGPWVGFDLRAGGEKLGLTGGLEYHWVQYRASADWNLRADFHHPESFLHTASGTGITGIIGLDYKLSDEWTLALLSRIRDFSTRAGTDTTFTTAGTFDTRLNEVNWGSYSISFAARYRFK